MHLVFQLTEDILVAAVYGELDHHSAASVRSEIDKTIDAFDSRHLVMDFKEVTFMDSSGIGVVMGRYNKVKDKKGELFVVSCSEYVEKILHMAGIFTIARKEEDKQDAIDRIKGQACRQLEMEVM